MHFSILITFITLTIFAIFTSAAPVNDVSLAADVKTWGIWPPAPDSHCCLLLTNDLSFGGDKYYGCFRCDKCIDLLPALSGKVASIGPDQRAGYCWYYDQLGCVNDTPGEHHATVYPGFQNVAWEGTKMRSFRCLGLIDDPLPPKEAS